MQTVPSKEEVTAAFKSSFEFQPSGESWGLFAYDDGPGGIGGGVGGFSWFESEQAVIEFIFSFPFLAHSGETEEVEIVAEYESIRQCLTKSRYSGKLDQATIDDINKLLMGIEQIKWWGQLRDLTSGMSTFAIELRESFSDEDKQAEIKEAQLNDFIKFLREYGC